MQNYIHKHLKKYLAWGLLPLTLSQACKSESGLYPVPETSISDQNVFDTPARIEGLVNGMYRSLKAASLYGGRYLLYQDVRGEDFINLTANSYTAFESWNNSYSSGSNDVNNLWSAAYATINSANIVIQGLNTTQVIPEAAAAAYIGEAKFLRALSYFSLITVFAQPYNRDQGASPGILLRLQAETGTANNDLARSTVAEVYTQIIQDLEEAEQVLPETYTTALLNTTRAHKNTAIALKTRVYLTIRNYAKVLEESAKIVPQTTAPFAAQRGVAHQLQSDIQVVFGGNYTTTESILSMPMTPTDALSGQSALGYVYLVNREYYLNPTGILGNTQWTAGDRRRGFLQANGGRQYLRKYAKASPYVDYIPVIRYAEVLLNYAEAAAESGQLSLAAALLQGVHHRSDASYNFPAETIANPSALLDAIAQERRIELLGEGFGGHDLLRRLQPLPAKGDANIQTPRVETSAQNYIFPPPNTELATNTLFR
ncbi:RagB/SusD family nutrient uptake outer membrane protein [Sphingobacterium sp. lm-10]|uniref:RagB/SusD family nutrient uptake outer membrane protein n=1 Tax=Sphingobacterium sp. lm-10 TaxID=2944904 RepID=UPI0020222010|nr:RagB/SusD family nutrient uptake outer membrane protein [Sphingobacterium sp. lm-10]MCL7987247.1 RagB/SusD family nutrient uptake outer membrane protein [Sphingobacterium sp. lm-10]